ncbi:hypothetical protein [Thalassotalea crassostreae]|uniref:hypothetical protein n=1 Tax=Thalassotalea crassostreae TaxID=1763536 RepID=UPI0008384DFE|nr:hypothetical protein [Thalassotalea crassostreae]
MTSLTSNEKGTGNIFCYISYVLSILILISICNSLLNGEVKPAFIFIPFLLFCLVIYLIGYFLNKKFNRLGKTPLTVSASLIPKGVKQHASIFVNQSNFNRIKNVQLKCLYTKYSTSGGTVLPHVLFEKNIPIDSEFVCGTTTLSFEFEIPKDMPSSNDDTPKINIDWELSFKFIDGLEEVSRTWTIHVK